MQWLQRGQWSETRQGWLGRDASHGRRWTITSAQSDGFVDLTLTRWTSRHVPVDTTVAHCMSVAEAQVFAAALDNAGHPAGTKTDDLLIDSGFKEAPHFSYEVERRVMDSVRGYSPDVSRNMHYGRRWFGSEDLSVFITTSRLSVFPFYCMTIDENGMAKPDTLLVEPRLLRAAASPYIGQNEETADPVIPTFAVACLAVLNKRHELNGSFAASLDEGQQHGLVDLFAAGYDWPEPEVEADTLLLGMGR